ncbi:hypothetical protein SAMN04488693_105180 [Arthrobacter subterraneus]|uniref:Uncharacterized protein n=1 Tax=Arthrobacter subterraneus TaxID=335973 RepID=A0A1G8HFC4_9MICC|nr:hypothetical protein [Arthrobacter subterraneus]SDI05343.1 hypothetical protein SAMN04488693_105180 [Arthrobacter subterraneus]
MRRAIALSAVLFCAALTSCSAPSPAHRYQQAISAVSGVADVEVDYARHGGTGDSTDVEIVADTNDSEELQRILDRSLRAFIESTDPKEETSLNYLVYSRDRSTYLTPSDLGTVLRTLADIRRHYGLD